MGQALPLKLPPGAYSVLHLKLSHIYTVTLPAGPSETNLRHLPFPITSPPRPSPWLLGFRNHSGKYFGGNRWMQWGGAAGTIGIWAGFV